MSKIFICTLRFDKNEWNGIRHIFLNGEKCTDCHPKSDIVYKQNLLKTKIELSDSNNNSLAISEILRIGKLEEKATEVMKFAQRLVDGGFLNEYIKEDIKNSNWDYLIDDLYDIISSNYRSDIVNLIPSLDAPCCFRLVEKDIQAFAISHLQDRKTGKLFYDSWSDALIEDFSKKGDDIILALHGSTDYKDDKIINMFEEKESSNLSTKYQRNIRLHVFSHQEGSGYIKPALLNDNLTDIWSILDSYGK